ncbi:hypothetical protein PYCCODRAFT_206558 [Trametes coccinea BRFM310]|uniref:F-box domain-containing protein n=1 Tax=Trametes coccinea (strain BRFM310) TaxID=1353009 RepID=A0A1Y2IRV2_TRAC3|nr:hypothetical protein PYCCODRAFT_206558 [Trametes coccinea BRFM310]
MPPSRSSSRTSQRPHGLTCISNLELDELDEVDAIHAEGLSNDTTKPPLDPGSATSGFAEFCGSSHTIKNPIQESCGSLLLPPELWLRVFRQVAFTNPESLIPMAKASTKFQGVVEEALYWFPYLSTTRSAECFLATISDHPHRARMVRGLQLGCREDQTDEYISAITSTFPFLARLQTLEITGLGNMCISEKTAADLFRGVRYKLPSLRYIRGLPLYLSPRLMAWLGRVAYLEELHIYAYTDVPKSDARYDLETLAVAGEPDPSILRMLPNLRALSCTSTVLADIPTSGSLTSLCITGATRAVLDHAASLFGEQLLSLRVERRLGRYSGMAYPTNWSIWTKFRRLTFLDVHDSGKREAEIEGQAIKVENLPPSLETLIWGASWAMDCALTDSRPESWRRERLRAFAETVLVRASGVKAVVYRWRWSSGTRKKSYHCVLAGDGRFREALADPAVADEDVWADQR